jgi:hypothetical protein
MIIQQPLQLMVKVRDIMAAIAFMTVEILQLVCGHLTIQMDTPFGLNRYRVYHQQAAQLYWKM